MDCILYSTGCPKCSVLKKKLEEKNIMYEECSSVERMLELGITTVPVLSVDSELMEFGEAIKWINNN